MKRKLNFKIAIIGAGPAGCSCAIALLNAGFKDITLVTNSKSGKFHIGESIPPNMNLILKQLGIYESFLNQNHEPCFGSCSYWGSDLRGYNDSILSPYGNGWHLDRKEFNKFLVEEAVNKGAKIMQPYTYQNISKIENGYRIKLSGKVKTEPLEVDFVVDATGHKSIIASDLGSKKNQETPLVCLGLTFKNKTNSKISKLTHLESVENGWWYAARIPGNLLLVTFYTTAKIVKKLSLNNLTNWMKLLNESPNTNKWIEQLVPNNDKIMGFHAPSFCLDKITGENWLAIGDAASAYDPITSQGIIKSFSQGIRASEIINLFSLGSKDALNQFENEVKSQHKKYQESRNYFYQLEQRWPDNDFWLEMHKMTTNNNLSVEYSHNS